jgi:hypothetical protein
MGGMLNALVGSFAPATASSSFESIATATVGSGGTTTVTFSSIPSTYTHLQLRFIARANYAGNMFSGAMRYNSDSGANYSWHAIYGSGNTSVVAYGVTGYTYDYSINVMGTNTSNTFGSNVVDILDYKNTNKFKTIRTLTGGDGNGSGSVGLMSTLWQSTAAINSISISTAGYGDFLQYSHFALYGIKGA